MGLRLAFLPHIGPVITSDPRIGVTLTADTDAVDNIDGIRGSTTFTYQWIRVSSGGTETDISGAMSATYTPVLADLGRTLKVKVSFTDVRSNAEEQTSRASLRVVPEDSANRAATGQPTISGTLRVTETNRASTSSIRDSDGVSGATFEYQWVRVRAGIDTDIPRETGSSYVLRAADQGQRVKVKGQLHRHQRQPRNGRSNESGVVGSALNRPPTFPATTASRVVEENTLDGLEIGDAFTATDLDGDTLTYSIKDDDGRFEVLSSSGQLQTKGAVDYEVARSHTVVVNAVSRDSRRRVGDVSLGERSGRDG